MWGGPTIAALVFAAYWSLRLAAADHFYRANTLESLENATRLDPSNARYHAWRAELEEHEGLDPSGELLRATALDPRDSAAWIRLGLRAELDGDYPTAERRLLEAARVDRLFAPRATLMEYYFRRGDRDQFWRWAREAFEMSYGDRTALFRLCWRAGDDAGLVRRALPSDAALLAQYLGFLLSEGRLDAAAPVAEELAHQTGPTQAAPLLDYCDRALAAGEVTGALAIWNALGGPRLAPANGILVTNGDFAALPSGRGFDWRVTASDQVTAVRSGPPDGLKLTLSGRQPERCDLLWQYVPLAPRRTHRLRFRYRTYGVPSPSGIRWEILAARTPDLAGDEWREAELSFSSGDASLARLVLVFERRPGTARAEGAIAVADVRLELVP